MSSNRTALLIGRRTLGSVCLGFTASLLLAGCQTLPAIVPCPLPVMEQAAKVQDLVPIGTSRDEAITKLKQAGIEGNFGTTKSIFYCDTWAKDNQERWHINVELLFDERGELYAYRPDPHGRSTAASEEPGAAKVTKKPKEVAAVKQAGIVDPFAE